MSRAEKKGQCNEEGVGSRLGLVVGAMAGKARLAGTNRPGCAGFDTSGTKRAFELADSTRLAPTVPPPHETTRQRCLGGRTCYSAVSRAGSTECPPGESPYIASICALHLLWITRRLSFIVGVSSSASGVHSPGRMVNRLNCSTRERCVLASVSARLTSSTLCGCSASSAIEAAGIPCALAHIGATWGSSTRRTEMNLSPSPIATAWPMIGLDLASASRLAEETC